MQSSTDLSHLTYDFFAGPHARTAAHAAQSTAVYIVQSRYLDVLPYKQYEIACTATCVATLQLLQLRMPLLHHSPKRCHTVCRLMPSTLMTTHVSFTQFWRTFRITDVRRKKKITSLYARKSSPHASKRRPRLPYIPQSCFRNAGRHYCLQFR